MKKTYHTKPSRYIEIAVPINITADKSLRVKVLNNLKNIYGNPLPESIKKRALEELKISTHLGYSQTLLVHEQAIQVLKKLNCPYYLLSPNCSLLINYALNITTVNPLPRHRFCPFCKYIEYVSDNNTDTGFLPTEKNCPLCGKKMITDGHNLRIESFLGHHYDRNPYLSIGVPNTKQKDATSLVASAFQVEREMPFDIRSKTDEYVLVYIDIVPIDGLSDKKETLAAFKRNDSKVFEFLSDPESYEYYLLDDSKSLLVKSLLEHIEIKNYSDLAKICGLLNSSKWLSYILPSLRNGSLNYRNIITFREDIYNYLINHNIDAKIAYDIMEITRKGKVSMLSENEDVFKTLIRHNIPKEYINNLKNINYSMTKAQAIEMAIMIYENTFRYLYQQNKNI